jgi:hypothetical protein
MANSSFVPEKNQTQSDCYKKRHTLHYYRTERKSEKKVKSMMTVIGNVTWKRDREVEFNSLRHQGGKRPGKTGAMLSGTFTDTAREVGN